jgi:phosphatidate cytidylyltransferase
MPFHFQTFKTRAVTAIVFVLIMLAGLLWNQWSFLILFSIIHFGCWIEYQELVGLIDPEYRKITWLHKYGIMVVGWGFMLYMTNDLAVFNTPLHVIGKWIFTNGVIVFGMTVIFFMIRRKANILAHSLMGLVYISLSWGLMMRFWGNMNQTVLTGREWIMPVVLVASIWINDTMAYLVGSFIGKTPLSAISPKKTWEGTVGGAILAVLLVTLVGHYAFHFPIKALVLISSMAAIAGTVGDLFESKLKRLAGVKDSGRIMPGHGGFLDRFDSLLLATTVVWAVFYLLY